MADAAAKAHLRSRVTSAYEMDLARHVTNRACIYTHEEEGQAPEIRDRRLYQEAKEKIGRWVRKRLDGGHAARKGGDDNVWRTVIKATGTISGDTRYEGDKERGPNSTQRQPEACGEKARLRLVHGMRTGQTRGIEHGRRWRASLEAEARQDGWDEEGGGACADGAEGCWHPGCCRTIANTMHVLCAECEAVKGERREHYREMRKGAADVLKALRWTPPKSRRRTLAHTAECEAQALAVRAIAGATKRCAGRRESDEEWEAMEQLLAGRLPEPSVMDQDPPEDIMREYDTRVVTSLKALQQTAASIIKVREGKRKGLEAERKERVAAETERLREGQKERKERIREMEWAANACICWRRRRHRQRDAEEKEREEAERRLEAGRGRTTRAMGTTLKTTHCELSVMAPAPACPVPPLQPTSRHPARCRPARRHCQ